MDKIYETGRNYADDFKKKMTIKFDQPVQQIVFQEYIDCVKKQQECVKGLEKEMEKALDSWRLAPVVEALMALRGCKLITAMTVMAELGDITRFDSPRQLMAYLGLVPSEYSSGKSTRRGGITKTGNGQDRYLSGLQYPSKPSIRNYVSSSFFLRHLYEVEFQVSLLR